MLQNLLPLKVTISLLMFKKSFLALFLLLGTVINAQYKITGQLLEFQEGDKIFLSLIEDYRKLERPYFEQIIKSAEVDSLGFFQFEGNNLSPDNRIYRIHVDGCGFEFKGPDHFFNRCNDSKSVLFIANNRDTISFPVSTVDEVLCQLSSTNKTSSLLLEVDELKEQMALDFYDFPSETSRNLNAKKWFATLQDFGSSVEEPLVDLYIFNFLSDKRNDCYSFYLKDFKNNDYYKNLGMKLQAEYPDTEFTKYYLTETRADYKLLENQKYGRNWQWILAVLLIFSLALNLVFLFQVRKFRGANNAKSIESLTSQEQIVLTKIVDNKSNKEIADELFISLSTVKTHINNLYKKLQVSSREELKKRY